MPRRCPWLILPANVLHGEGKAAWWDPFPRALLLAKPCPDQGARAWPCARWRCSGGARTTQTVRQLPSALGTPGRREAG